MHFELDLAIAYACALGLLCWFASWLVPLAFGTAVRATADALRSVSTRSSRDANPPADRDSHHHDWWSPTHHSQ